MAKLIPPVFPGNARQNDPVPGILSPDVIFYLQDGHRNAAVSLSLSVPHPSLYSCLSFYVPTSILTLCPSSLNSLGVGLSDRAFVNGCYLELFDSGLGKEHRRLKR